MEELLRTYCPKVCWLAHALVMRTSEGMAAGKQDLQCCGGRARPQISSCLHGLAWAGLLALYAFGRSHERSRSEVPSIHHSTVLAKTKRWWC